MKSGTVIVLALAAAGILYYVTRTPAPGSPAAAAAAKKAAAVAAAKNTGAQDYAIKAGVDLAAKGGALFLDWLARPTDTVAVDIGGGDGAPELSLDPYAF